MLGIAEHEPGVAVAQHVVGHLAREAVVDRNRDEAGLHRTHEGDEVLAPVGRQQGHAVAAAQPELEQAARRSADLRIDLAEAQRARLGASEVDDRCALRCDRAEIDEVTEVVPFSHLLDLPRAIR